MDKDLGAGRELDARVAEKVMGLQVLGQCHCEFDEGEWRIHDWVREDSSSNESVFLEKCRCASIEEWDRRCGCSLNNKILGHYPGCLEVVPFYSTNIAAAWQVVEKLAERGWYFEISTDKPSTVSFSIHIRDKNRGTWDENGCSDGWVTEVECAPTAPVAICRAALAAVAAGGGNGEN